MNILSTYVISKCYRSYVVLPNLSFLSLMPSVLAFSSCIGRAKGAYCKVVMKHPGRILQELLGLLLQAHTELSSILSLITLDVESSPLALGAGGKIDLKVFSRFWLSFSHRQPQGETDCINASSWCMRLTCITENMELKRYCFLQPELERRDKKKKELGSIQLCIFADK